MVSNHSGCCALCSFRGCDGDWCRHGAYQKDNGSWVCNFTGTEFSPEILDALSRTLTRQALATACTDEELSIVQVDSPLDVRFGIAYRGFQASITLDDIAHPTAARTRDWGRLRQPASDKFGMVFDDSMAPGAPDGLTTVATALCSRAGFRVTGEANIEHAMRTLRLVRGEERPEGSFRGTHIDLTYVVEVPARWTASVAHNPETEAKSN